MTPEMQELLDQIVAGFRGLHEWRVRETERANHAEHRITALLERQDLLYSELAVRDQRLAELELTHPLAIGGAS